MSRGPRLALRSLQLRSVIAEPDPEVPGLPHKVQRCRVAFSAASPEFLVTTKLSLRLFVYCAALMAPRVSRIEFQAGGPGSDHRPVQLCDRNACRGKRELLGDRHTTI